MKQIIEELHSCQACQNTCFKGYIDFPFPEAFLGNPSAKFAIVGANPGPIADNETDKKWLTDYLKKIENYIQHCIQRISFEQYLAQGDFRGWKWIRGYIQAFNLLTGLSPEVDNDAIVSFNENVIILNVVKCSTNPLWEGIPDLAKETAKDNCIDYLRRQLELINPRIILTHSRFACDAIIEMLDQEENYKADPNSSSISLKELSKLKMDRVLPQSRLSYHYVIAKNKDRDEALFLFNKHLSYTQSAIHNLRINLDTKKKLVQKFLQLWHRPRSID